MIVDTSAVLAILRAEPDASAMAAAIADASTCRISAANYLEAAIVIDSSRDPVASARFDEFVREAGLLIEPVDEAQAQIARRAYQSYGKGSGHAAGLNFGDCFAYALARVKAEPLLFKGSDFVHTDLQAALRAEALPINSEE